MCWVIAVWWWIVSIDYLLLMEWIGVIMFVLISDAPAVIIWWAIIFIGQVVKISWGLVIFLRFILISHPIIDIVCIDYYIVLYYHVYFSINLSLYFPLLIKDCLLIISWTFHNMIIVIISDCFIITITIVRFNLLHLIAVLILLC